MFLLYQTADKNLVSGVLFALFGFFGMALFGALLKESSMGTSPFWTCFFAYLTALVLFVCLFGYKGISFYNTKRLPLHFARAFFGVLASIAYIAAMAYIPLLNATLLFNSTPLFIPIFSMILLKDRVGWPTWSAIFLGFIGITFIIRPHLDTLLEPGNLLGIGSGILLALAFVYIKMMTNTEPRERILLYFFALSTLMQFPFIPLYGPFPPLYSLFMACLAGVALVMAQWGIVKAYERAPASSVGIFQYSAVVFIGIIDWLIWHATPTLFDVIGTIIVILAGALILTIKNPGKPHAGKSA